MFARHIFGLSLLTAVTAVVGADEPKKADAKTKGEGHAVTFKPGDPKAAAATASTPAEQGQLVESAS